MNAHRHFLIRLPLASIVEETKKERCRDTREIVLPTPPEEM